MSAVEYMLKILKNRDYYKKFLISQRQVDIVNFIVESGSVSSVDVANKFNVSIQSASTQLKKLKDIGYLCRRELVQESGGSEYEYWCRIKRKPANTLSNAGLPTKKLPDILLDN